MSKKNSIFVGFLEKANFLRENFEKIKNNYLLSKMKKIIFAIVALLAMPYVVSAQDVNPTMDEENPDSIKVTYVPNKFKDNWELSIAGGVSVLIDNMRYDQMTGAPYNATGGVGEITATKWFNPYIAGRFGWMTGYLPYKMSKDNALKADHPDAAWHNYGHIDMLWDWTTQFGGYKPDRKYDAVPYIHAGIVGNPAYNIMVGGGLGFLNRFHINEHWLINLDLRATATSARKFGLEGGLAVELNALLGVTYRFNTAGWKKKMYNPYGPEVSRLKDENKDLLHQVDELRMKNDELARKAKAEAEAKRIKEQVTKEVYGGLPDTLEMTVYYAINSSKLSSYEQAHLRTYLRVIKMNDPEGKHHFLVTGTADKGTGSLEYNKQLSAARAEAIKQALLDNGIQEEQIEVRTEIVPSGDAKMARASHVVMFPLPKQE